jgi:hypothetical protein
MKRPTKKPTKKQVMRRALNDAIQSNVFLIEFFTKQSGRADLKFIAELKDWIEEYRALLNKLK